MASDVLRALTVLLFLVAGGAYHFYGSGLVDTVIGLGATLLAGYIAAGWVR